MKLRVIVKSHENGSNEQTYLCTDEDMFKSSAESFFFMEDNDSIDTDEIIDGLEYLDTFLSLPLAFDRPLKEA